MTMLHLGAANICLDQAQNAVDCQDPECTYGDCGAPSGYVPTGGCLDQHENQVMCMDPECTYGDCLPPSKPSGVMTIKPAVTQFPTGSVQLPPGPANRVSIPVFPLNPTSVELFVKNNWPILAAVGAGVLLLGSVSGGRRRR